LARWLIRAARLPPPAEAVETRLVVCRRGSAERWHRTFGDTIVVTSQREAPDGLLAERLGLLEFRFRLAVADGALIYRQTGLVLRLGPVCLPLPRRLSPQVTAREEPAARPGEMHVSVEVRTLAGALLFSYEGSVRPEGAMA
jgi:hypothetical protein